MEEVTISNRRGHRLAGKLHRPSNSDGIVIITHSFKGDMDYDRISVSFCEAMEKEGVACLRFDCYGSGKSDGEFVEATVKSELEDLEDVIKYAKGSGYSKICLAGLSQGAALSILAYTEEITCLLLWSPAFDLSVLYNKYKDDFEGREYIYRSKVRTGEMVKIGKAMWKDFGKTDLLGKVKEIKSPSLIIYGKDDEDHFKGAEKYVKEFARPPAMIVIDDCDHDFLDQDKEDRAVEQSVQFVKRNLK